MKMKSRARFIELVEDIQGSVYEALRELDTLESDYKDKYEKLLDRMLIDCNVICSASSVESMWDKNPNLKTKKIDS